MSDVNPHQDQDRRHSDGMIIALNQRFNDFIERYDRDTGANNEWRRTVEIKMDEHGKILADINPAYLKGKWIIGLIMVGSIGLAVHAFWSHITWR
jgi:hypothetical protein